MSLIVDFSIFPVDKGESLGSYVARVVRIIEESGLPYKLGPMGTSIEGEWDEVMAVVTRSFEDLKMDCDRISLNLKADYRTSTSGRIETKVESVVKKL
jgi:uncharacterized protein (TIGR00106 family)